MWQREWTTIDCQLDEGILQIALNRPDLLNSVNTAMRAELSEAFSKASVDPDIRVVLLTGNGRAFCAGQDLGERKPLPDGQKHDLGKSLDREYNPLMRQIAACEKPLIAAVNGVAAGAGVSLALMADVTFASNKARFVLSFANIGLGPDCGASWMLPRLIGAQRAKAFAMSGQPVNAESAAAWGMIWQAVPAEELLSAAREFSHTLAAKGPLALAVAKRTMNDGWENSFSEQLDLERDTQRELGLTDDYTEGVAAFREKRPAQFQGR